MKVGGLLLLATAWGELHGAPGAVEHPCVFGVEMFMSSPAGALNDLYTSDVGRGVGLFLEWDFGNGHGLRSDMSLATSFPPKNKVLQGRETECSLTSSCTMVSYTYHLKRAKQGPFLMAGLGMKTFEARFQNPWPVFGQASTGDGILTRTRCVADTGSKLAWMVGAGYHLSLPVGITVRCVGMQAMGHTLTTLEGGINIRF